MSKFRLVKERREDKGSEFDLRELGRDPLVSDSHPISALAIHTTDPKGVMNLAQHHHLAAHYHSSEKLVTIHIQHPQAGDHKTHSVQLYLFVLKALPHLKEGTHSYLFELSRLRHRIQDAIHDDHHSLNEMILTEHAHHDSHHFFSLGSHSAHALRQAGFAIEPKGDETVHFTREEVRTHRENVIHELHSETQQAPKRKAA